jgi:hypothetical protein
MKKLQIMIEDELMAELKIMSFKQGKSLKDLVTEMITAQLGTPISEPQPKAKAKAKAKQVQEQPTPTYKPKRYPNPLDDEYQNEKKEDFYLLRKPAYRGDTLKENTKFTDGVVEWELLAGSIPHYDADGKLIPFACTMEFNNKMYWPPFENEIEEIAEAYGKPVKIEE